MNMLTHRPITTKPMNFKRSAIEPVGMVAAVSMKTIWNRKKASSRRVGSKAGQQETAAAEKSELTKAD